MSDRSRVLLAGATLLFAGTLWDFMPYQPALRLAPSVPPVSFSCA